MRRNCSLFFIGVVVMCWLFFLPERGMPYADLIGSIELYGNPRFQEEGMDSAITYLDSIVWEQMMIEAERVSPSVAKANYAAQKSGVGNINAASQSTSFNTLSILPSQVEYDALMDFYQEMDGPNWFNNSGWSTANPNVVQDVSNFHGVMLNEEGHVKWLIFWQNNLNGAIPESFGDLTYLEHIQMVRNPYIGQLPQSLGALDKVVELLLYGNNMAGTIPSTIGI